MNNSDKLYCEKSYWERLATQSDMISKFLTWLHKKQDKGGKFKEN